MLALAGLGGGFMAFVAVRIAHSDHTAVSMHNLATVAAQPLWFLAVIVAVLATAGEFQHHTIHATLLHAPRRSQVLAAKTLTAAGYGAALTLTGTLSALATGLISAKLNHTPTGPINPTLLIPTSATVLLGALSAVLAAGLGTLARNTTIALVTLLLWRFVLEGIAPSLISHPDLRPWLPSGTADALLTARPDLLPPWAAALTLTGYATLLTIAGAWTLTRYDAQQ
jgi:ABC-type transport system involved in multi-copper enzyme maturation permease subunit